MTTARVVETSVVINNNSPIQEIIHLDNHTQPTYKYYIEQSVLGRAGRKEPLAQWPEDLFLPQEKLLSLTQ